MKTYQPHLTSLLCFGFIAACGGTTLDPVQDGTGGAGTGGVGANTSGGTGGTATGGASGSGGASACTSPNPVGCVQSGCAAGLICDTTVKVCVPSNCGCDESTGNWLCTDDCGGGVCTPDPKASQYFARIGFVDGQVKIPEFCVAYKSDSEGYLFETQGLLGLHGEVAADLNGLKRLTKYLPLKQQPLAFGIASAANGCAAPSYIADMPIIDTLGLPPTHFTVLSAPYSNEPPELWVLADSGPKSSDGKGRVRVINATTTSYDLTNLDADGSKLGTAVFGGQGVSDYQNVAKDHLVALNFGDFGGSYSADFTGGDLLALHWATIIVAGWQGNYHAIGCVDGNGSNAFCMPASVKKLP
ncbi:MAG TPA: hypothetical protein PKA88_00135 [Polyangiaceae bacterium]|nr:hypothetical protein [Polyangiaceae bacterium]